MRYFTPELYMRLQDLSDLPADEEWEQALERYNAEVDRLMPRFPEGVKYYLSNVRLHDAEILSMGLSGSTLTMTCALEPPDTRLVTLRYTLAEPPQILREVYDAAFCSVQPEFMYDEIGLDETSGAFTHDILLGNGWEIRLKFRELEITWSEALYPVRAAALSRSV
jgi:hypothetical protein